MLRALEKDYSKRFASVYEFAQALERAVGLASVPSGQLTVPVSTPSLELRQPPASLKEQNTDLPLRQNRAPVVNEPTPAASAGAVEIAPIGAVLCTYRGHSTPACSLAWNPDGQRIISAGREKTIHIWDGRTGDNLHIYRDLADFVLFVGWSADGRYVATAGSDMQVRVWDFTTNRLVSVYRGHVGVTITAFAWSPDASEPLLATASNDAIHVWEATGARLLTIYRGHSATISALTWSSDGKHLASGSIDGLVQIWQAATGKTLAVYAETGQAAGVLSVAWSPDALRPLLEFPRTHDQGGSRVACGRADGQIQMWEVATGRQVLSYRHSAPVNLLSWSPDGRRFAHSSGDATVLVWDTLTNLKLYTFFQPATTLIMGWLPDSKYLATGGADNTVQVWVAP